MLRASCGKGWFHTFGRKLQKGKSANRAVGATFQPHRSDMGARDSEDSLDGGGEGEAPYRTWGCVT